MNVSAASANSHRGLGLVGVLGLLVAAIYGFTGVMSADANPQAPAKAGPGTAAKAAPAKGSLVERFAKLIKARQDAAAKAGHAAEKAEAGHGAPTAKAGH